MQPIADSGLSQLAARLLSLVFAPLQILKTALLKRSGHGKVRRMVLLESLELGNRRQLFLVSCDDHRFLVGAGAERVGTLVAVPEQAQDAVSLRTGASQSQVACVPAQRSRPAWRRAGAAHPGGSTGLQIVKRQDGLVAGAVAEASGPHGAETGGSRWR